MIVKTKLLRNDLWENCGDYNDRKKMSSQRQGIIWLCEGLSIKQWLLNVWKMSFWVLKDHYIPIQMICGSWTVGSDDKRSALLHWGLSKVRLCTKML
jgi:hypothetical protein